jgi:hypothetical protein
MAVVPDGRMIGQAWMSDVNLRFVNFEPRRHKSTRSHMHVRAVSEAPRICPRLLNKARNRTGKRRPKSSRRSADDMIGFDVWQARDIIRQIRFIKHPWTDSYILLSSPVITQENATDSPSSPTTLSSNWRFGLGAARTSVYFIYRCSTSSCVRNLRSLKRNWSWYVYTIAA